MIIRLVVIVALFLPLRVIAWEDEVVLSFISQVNPLIGVNSEYGKYIKKRRIRGRSVNSEYFVYPVRRAKYG